MSQPPPIYRDEQPFRKPQPLGGTVYTGQPNYRPPGASNPAAIIAKVLGVLFLVMILVVGLLGFAGYMVFSVVREKTLEANERQAQVKREIGQEVVEQRRRIEAEMAAQHRKIAEDRARALAERPIPVVAPSTNSGRPIAVPTNPTPSNPAPGQFSSDVQKTIDAMNARMEANRARSQRILDDARANTPLGDPSPNSGRSPATPPFAYPPPLTRPDQFTPPSPSTYDAQKLVDEMNARAKANRDRSQKIMDDMRADSDRRLEELRQRRQEMRNRIEKSFEDRPGLQGFPPLPR